MSSQLAWGNRLTLQQQQIVESSCKRLGLDPSSLTTCMMLESNMDPQAHNPGSSAIGLIQFMDATAFRLGTTTAALAHMKFEQQMPYVESYFRGFEVHGHDLSAWTRCDTYMAILWPAAIGKGEDYVLFAGNAAYRVNKGLDVNKDGRVTKGEVCVRVTNMYNEGMKPGNVRPY